MFHAHSRTKLKLGPELIWGYEMRLEMFLEQPEVALAHFLLFSWAHFEPKSGLVGGIFGVVWVLPPGLERNSHQPGLVTWKPNQGPWRGFLPRWKNWSMLIFKIALNWLKLLVCTLETKVNIPILLSIDISMCLANQTKNKLIFFLISPSKAPVKIQCGWLLTKILFLSL